MDDTHLINTLTYVYRRTEEINTQGKYWATLINARILNLKKEAKKRGLMPTVYKKIGDVRGMVAATYELHSKPDFVKRALQEKSNGNPHTETAEGHPRIRR